MQPTIDSPKPPVAPNGRTAGSGDGADDVPPTEFSRETSAVVELFVGVFKRDLASFFPHARFDRLDQGPPVHGCRVAFDLAEDRDEIAVFGRRYTIAPREFPRLTPMERKMVRALGSVLSFRYHDLFQRAGPSRLELYRGGGEDHYVAAFVEPEAYAFGSSAPSRIASTVQTLRTAALSTYENRRVSTGALLAGSHEDPAHSRWRAPPDALPYGVELTGLKSIHRLCDGTRTVFLVDPAGKLAGIADIARFASELPDAPGLDIPCARAYRPHARATRSGGHLCLVLSPNQEIKLFAGGVQAFTFAHGRWRILDPSSKFATWQAAVGSAALARATFQAALDLAEARQGGLFVVVRDPEAAIGRLVAPLDLLCGGDAPCGPPADFAPHDPLAKRALHYLARGRTVRDLDPAVLEALASLDGAVVFAPDGTLLAFGAILRHGEMPGMAPVEGARTTAALVASRFGPVLKVSEDGIVSCFLDGRRAWDL